MKVFVICSVVVVVVLAVIVGVAWYYAPPQHFLGVSAVCYGYVLGWFGAWWANYYWSHRWPRQKSQGPFNAVHGSL
jgi:hypothetical protein